MIKWNDISTNEFMTLDAITKRAKNLDDTIEIGTCMIAVTAVHQVTPLRLDELLKAPKEDFIHDIRGIMKNINSQDGSLSNSFVPRYVMHQ
jgi:hypothetical protein